VTVPTGYNANLLKAGRAKIYFVKHELFSLGVTKLKSPYGNDIKAYSLERTICDVIRSRNQMEIQFINEALKLIPSAFEDKRIEVWAYPIETILEEKVETILSRSVLNTRPRDFYDVYILVKTQSQVINSDIFQTALETTARKRMSLEALQNSESTIHPG
jgi:predicted nucleotidyltransferase component of viral defense system